MDKLDKLQGETLKLFDALNRTYPKKLAGPFVSVPPTGYSSGGRASFLYVGKATAEDWGKTPYLKAVRSGEALAERRKKTREFIEKGARPSPFWTFAKSLSRPFSGKSWEIGEARNLVWTNLCKLGTLEGNPSGSIKRCQFDHAVCILRAEIDIYRPRFVVFAAGDYGYDMIGHIVNDPEHKHWEKPNRHLWWRAARDGLPAILWTRHPQGASGSLVQDWLERARALSG